MTSLGLIFLGTVYFYTNVDIYDTGGEIPWINNNFLAKLGVYNSGVDGGKYVETFSIRFFKDSENINRYHTEYTHYLKTAHTLKRSAKATKGQLTCSNIPRILA